MNFKRYFEKIKNRDKEPKRESKIVKEKETLRTIINTSVEMSTLAYDTQEDVSVILDKAEQHLFSVSENNYLGNGIRLDASLYLTEESIRGLFSVDNPNWNYSGNSLRTTIESTKVDKLADSGYESSKTGFSFGTQFEQWENIYISPSISTYYESISTDSTASDALKKQDGTSFDTYLRYAIIDDKRNQRFQPSEGSRKSFNQKIPLYSGNPSILNGFNYAGYYSPTDNIIGSLKFYGRAINSLSDDDVRVSERLFIPSRLLRGFERGKVGPRDSDDLETAHALGSLIMKAINKMDPFVIWGDGNPIREYIYAKDAAKGMLLAMEKYCVGDPINLASGESVSITELAKKILKISKTNPTIEFDKEKPSGQKRRVLSDKKAQEKIGFIAETSLDDGIEKTIKWYKQKLGV